MTVKCLDGRVEENVVDEGDWYASDYHIEPDFSKICPIPRYLLPKKFWKPA